MNHKSDIGSPSIPLGKTSGMLTAGRSQCGFSLIELMIAITLGLLIMVAMLALFVNITRTNNEMAKSNSQIENGRFAMQLLQNNIVHAGFWGGYVPQFDDLTITTVPSGAPTAVPDVCLAYNPGNWNAVYISNLIGISVQSYDGVPTGCSAVVASKKTNTDVLVVRHAETCLPGVGSCEADTAGRLYFQASNCASELTATPYVLNAAGFSLRKRDCATLSDKRRFVSSIYYIRDYAATAGDGIPTLVRSQFDLPGPAHQPAVPLIEGIEGFQVELGIDSLSDSGAAVNYSAATTWANPTNLTSPTNRGDGAPDGDFVRCTTASPCTAAQLTDVVAVKLYVLARNRDVTPGHTDTKTYTLGSTTLGPFNDQYQRHVFSTSVRLTNISGRRETPP